MGTQVERRPVLGVAQKTHLLPSILPNPTVANAPSATLHTGGIIFVSNGAAGSPVLAFSDGTDWLRSDTRAAIAAS